MSKGMESTWSNEFSLDLSGLNIMIVEENLGMRRLLVSVLKAFGIDRVITSETGEEALGGFSSYDPDIITTDLMMHDMDGIKLTHLIRNGETDLSVYIPIIMISGSSRVSEIELARDSGVTEFLVKPVFPKTLFHRLVSVIQHPRSFIRTKHFFGPERRRRILSFKGIDRRRKPHDYSQCQQRVSPR